MILFDSTVNPEIQPVRLAVKVRQKALPSIREGHPWLFEDSIEKVSKPGKPGDVAVIFDSNQKFVAAGLYDPCSPVRVKIFSNSSSLPPVGPGLFEYLAQQAALNRQGKIPPDTNAWRLIHGDSDGFPGLVADRYDISVVVKVYSAAILPWLKDIVTALCKTSPGLQRLVIRLSRELQNMKPALRCGYEDGEIYALDPVCTDEKWDGFQIFSENGVRFGADLRNGQKTGFFLDQRGNRAMVGKMAENKDVLNLFSYSGGFSLYAAKGGAKSVVSVDFNKHAIESCEENFELNRKLYPAVKRCRHTGIADDAFHAMDQLRSAQKSFDLIIVDPPSFAKSKEEIPGALHSYARLARSAVKLLRKNGTLVFASCSSRVDSDTLFETVLHAAEMTGRPLQEIRRTYHEADHPAKFKESNYLKCLYAKG